MPPKTCIFKLAFRKSRTMNSLLLASLAFLACARAQSPYQEPIPIVREQIYLGENGQYSLEYETANGINAQEIGSRKNAGTEGEAQLVQGRFSYTSPDGTPIATSYTADENGFQASGSHLPVGPPIPPLIQRALDWIAAHPQQQQEQQRY